MAGKNKIIIMRFEIPVIGRYEIDEGLTCIYKGQEFAHSNSIDNAKEKIRTSIAEKMKVSAVELQTTLAQLNGINVGLLEEKYRIEAFKD